MTGLYYKFNVYLVGQSIKLIYIIITKVCNNSFVIPYTLLCTMQQTPEICTVKLLKWLRHKICQILSKLYANCIVLHQVINAGNKVI